MKKIHFLSFLLLCIASTVCGQEVFIGNAPFRTSTSLNGKWEYVLDPFRTEQMGGKSIYRNATPQNKTDRVEYSFNAAQTLWVPGSWNTQKPELTYYEGNIWYRRKFDVDNYSTDKRYFVYVGAANYIAKVSVNSESAGRHEGGFTPFCFEVTHLLQEKDNYLIIGVNAARRADNIPAEVADWFNHGGITRDVLLIETPQTFISNHFMALDKSTLGDKTRKIKGCIVVNGKKMPQHVQIQIPELKIDKQIPVASDGTAHFTLEAPKLKLWSPETPKLYRICIIAGKDSLKMR